MNDREQPLLFICSGPRVNYREEKETHNNPSTSHVYIWLYNRVISTFVFTKLDRLKKGYCYVYYIIPIDKKKAVRII